MRTGGLMMRRLKDARGFTLLEVMITVVILVIGLLGLAGLQIMAIKGNSFGQQMSVASTLAQNQLEQLRRISYDSLSDGSSDGNDQYTDAANGVTYNRQWAAVTDVSHPDWLTLNVTVSWTGPTAGRAVTLSTIVSNS
jgi:type IV pilus modification protein PilV